MGDIDPQERSGDEDGEEIEDNTVPLGDGDFLDKMPQTGENADPFNNLMAGLALVLAGGVTIIGVKKKTAEDD
jgi:LPXTG-motif cell wall-anchored protein